MAVRRRAANPDDPRIKRTIKLLGDALMQLIVEKGYSAINIQDITERADVSRTTFYLHFNSIDDLLFERMREMYEELGDVAKSLDWNDPKAVEEAMCDPMDFEHVQRYLDFYRVMFSDKGSMAFLLRVMDYLARVVEKTLRDALPAGVEPNIPLGMLAYSSAGTEIAVIRWWILNGMVYTPQEMANMLYQAQVKGVWWSLGLKKTE